jgi:hypothetical protein
MDHIFLFNICSPIAMAFTVFEVKEKMGESCGEQTTISLSPTKAFLV